MRFGSAPPTPLLCPTEPIADMPHWVAVRWTGINARVREPSRPNDSCELPVTTSRPFAEREESVPRLAVPIASGGAASGPSHRNCNCQLHRRATLSRLSARGLSDSRRCPCGVPCNSKSHLLLQLGVASGIVVPEAGTGCQAGTGGVDLTGRRGLSASPRREQSPGIRGELIRDPLLPQPPSRCRHPRPRGVRARFEELMSMRLQPDNVERTFLVFSSGASRPARHHGAVALQLTKCARSAFTLRPLERSGFVLLTVGHLG